MKLIKISGAIETLNLRNTKVEVYLTDEFFKALGENKTLKYLNMNTTSPVTNTTSLLMLGTAVAMNAYRNGALESLCVANWFNGYDRFRTYFLPYLHISERDHELWYGDKRLA